MIRKQITPMVGTVSLTPGLGAVVPIGQLVGDTSTPAIFRTLAVAEREPKTFWARVGWWSRLYVGGPKWFLTPVAPPAGRRRAER